jgi:two-component system nitrogen regulation response regulator NtrX
MSLKTQAKILRILQEQKFERVGGVKTIRVDVRIIAASNKNLEEEMERGHFRADLYYRLNVVTLRVPALRERPSDIPLLAEEFLSAYTRANNLGVKTFSEEMLRLLAGRSWPGNVRELKNLVERLAIMTPGAVIGPEDEARPGGPAPLRAAAAGDDFLDQPYREARAEFERRYFRHHLDRHGRNITQTAEAVNLDRTSLHKKIKALGLKTGGEEK